jgi:hypothetical protein
MSYTELLWNASVERTLLAGARPFVRSCAYAQSRSRVVDLRAGYQRQSKPHCRRAFYDGQLGGGQLAKPPMSFAIITRFCASKTPACRKGTETAASNREPRRWWYAERSSPAPDPHLRRECSSPRRGGPLRPYRGLQARPRPAVALSLRPLAPIELEEDLVGG